MDFAVFGLPGGFHRGPGFDTFRRCRKTTFVEGGAGGFEVNQVVTQIIWLTVWGQTQTQWVIDSRPGAHLPERSFRQGSTHHGSTHKFSGRHPMEAANQASGRCHGELLTPRD